MKKEEEKWPSVSVNIYGFEWYKPETMKLMHTCYHVRHVFGSLKQIVTKKDQELETTAYVILRGPNDIMSHLQIITLQAVKSYTETFSPSPRGSKIKKKFLKINWKKFYNLYFYFGFSNFSIFGIFICFTI